MKNNCEIINNTFCKKCFEHHKQITGQKPINCAFKAFDNEYCDEVQELADYITNLQTQLNHQKAMWKELKEWLFEILEEKQNSPKYYKLNEVLDKMQELEGEKDVKD